MAEREQITRTSLAWLLVAQAVILLPHSVHAPLWLWAGWVCVVAWRWQIFRGAWSFPSLWVRLGLMAGFGGGLVMSYGARFDMTAMVGLLLAGFILKLLELRRRRDLLVTVYLGYFVSATQFLFHSGPLAGVYGVLSLLLLTATLLAAHQSLGSARFWPSIRQAGWLVLQATPLMLVLFLVIPRTGALWSVPQDRRAATTGISDSMSPGDIGELAQSNALAFRVTFDGAAPPPSERYWRGLVFSYFDGRQWQPTDRQRATHLMNWRADAVQQWVKQVEPRGAPVAYDVMLEPTRQPWLYALAAPVSWSDNIGVGQEMRLQRDDPVMQRTAYSVRSHTGYWFQRSGLSEWERRQELQLPGNSNPETRATARQWAREASSPGELIERVMGLYQERFRYTLRPQTLGQHSVDEFLWRTQEGFCEHFASSFVFFLRAAGIPARVVVGYLGATHNPLEDYWTVRQRDAHAWAEVWLEGQGWVRYDPTGAVAPERIEQGLDVSLSATDGDLLQRPFGADLPLVMQLQLRWDALNYEWHRWVLGYDQGRQEDFLDDWLGGADLWRIALAVVLAGASLVALLLLWMFWQQRPRYRYPADRQLARLERKLARMGCPRRKGEPLTVLARRLGQQHAALEPAMIRIAALYERVNYGDNRAALVDLTRAVTAFKGSRLATKSRSA